MKPLTGDGHNVGHLVSMAAASGWTYWTGSDFDVGSWDNESEGLDQNISRTAGHAGHSGLQRVVSWRTTGEPETGSGLRCPVTEELLEYMLVLIERCQNWFAGSDQKVSELVTVCWF